MQYPDNRPINIGDRVWWDGGIGVGYIRSILEDQDAFASLGIDEPSVLISMASDFSCGAPYVGYPHRLLEDDGIALLNAEESNQVGLVLSATADHLDLDSISRIGLWRECSGPVIKRWFAVHYEDGRDSCFSVSPNLSTIDALSNEHANRFYLRFK